MYSAPLNISPEKAHNHSRKYADSRLTKVLAKMSHVAEHEKVRKSKFNHRIMKWSIEYIYSEVPDGEYFTTLPNVRVIPTISPVLDKLQALIEAFLKRTGFLPLQFSILGRQLCGVGSFRWYIMAIQRDDIAFVIDAFITDKGGNKFIRTLDEKGVVKSFTFLDPHKTISGFIPQVKKLLKKYDWYGWGDF